MSFAERERNRTCIIYYVNTVSALELMTSRTYAMSRMNATLDLSTVVSLVEHLNPNQKFFLKKDIINCNYMAMTGRFLRRLVGKVKHSSVPPIQSSLGNILR